MVRSVAKRDAAYRDSICRDPGYALVIALFVLAAMMAAGAMIAGSLTYRMALLREETRGLQLTALADAALAQALAELSLDANYPGSQGPRPFADGTIATVAYGIGAQRVAVEVRATYQGGGRAARAEVNLLPLEVLHWEPMPFQP